MRLFHSESVLDPLDLSEVFNEAEDDLEDDEDCDDEDWSESSADVLNECV